MKFFIVFTVALAVAAAIENEYQPDSSDVAAAKLAHFVEKAKAAAAVGAEPDYITSYYINYYKNYAQGSQSNYNPAAITVLPSGYLADTPEVAAAKAAHFAEQAKAAYAAGAPAYNYYNIPAGSVLPNGYLADTPEVAAAKASFYSEYARAAAAAN